MNCQLKCSIAQKIPMIAHDLRAPLGTFEYLLHLPDDAAIGTYKNAIAQSLRRLSSMIESIRHQEDTITRKRCHIDFRQGLVGLESKLSKGVKILFPETSSGEFFLDLEKIERAYVNLLQNALDAAHSMVRIELEIRELDLYFKVIDDGPGISPEILPNLFQRGMTHGKPGGTGFGLAYVRQIIQGHGGEVVYRREGLLTVFECTLPGALDIEL